MTDEPALLAAIRQALDDDAPRLVYADWLDEHGQPERAEFIRAQCELARTNDPTLRRREAELLAAHHDSFAGPLAAPHLRFRFERGFVIGFGHTGVFACRFQSEQHSDRWIPAPARAWFRMYRFHPDGRVQLATTRFDSLVAVDHDFRKDGPASSGVYTLNCDLSPPGLQVSMLDGSGAIRGRLKPTAVLLEDIGSVPGGEAPPTRYRHHPIPGFDSFPET